MNRDKKKDHIEARRYIQKKLLSIYNKEIWQGCIFAILVKELQYPKNTLNEDIL